VCKATLARAAQKPLDERASTILSGCPVCGDWTPILDWNRPQKDGGPTRLAIEAAMERCHAYCDATAKMYFLGTLDDARGTTSNKPWIELGKQCKDKVSAVPDTRYISAMYFALDRVARAASARPDVKALLDFAIELPPVSITGAGVDLPTVREATRDIKGYLLTLLGDSVYLGGIPSARFQDGRVVAEGNDFPGQLATRNFLARRLGSPKREGGGWFYIVAPKAMAAAKLLPLLDLQGEETHFYLAVDAGADAVHWPGIAALPVELQFGNDRTGIDLTIGPDMTFQDLATELAKRADRHVVYLHGAKGKP
jgi:hypothetical protein